MNGARMAEQRKVYLYCDESGQDTLGRFFLVAVVLVDADAREALEQRVTRLEVRARRRGQKWHRSTIRKREAFLRELPHVAGDALLAWGEWAEGTEYAARTADAVARAADVCCPGAQVTVIIDGLTDAERPAVSRALRARGVRFRKVAIGCRDESFPLLRLADAAVGYLRDVEEGVPYAVELWAELAPLFTRL